MLVSLYMTDSRDKRAAEIQAAIRHILLHEWDPIGIANIGPDDEYDSYIGPVYRILAGSRSEQDLADLLFRTARDTIGVNCESPDEFRSVARRLLGLDVTL
jgi:hypothetical protein